VHKNQQSHNAELLETVIRFVMKICLLNKMDLKGKKKVAEEVQEGDKAHWKEKISERRRHKEQVK